MVTSVINSILAQNKVSGAAPALVAATPDFTRPGNPQILVTLQRTNLPTFFARIWGTKLVTVTATAVAEAYNASNSQNSTGNYVPITPKCVKPLLIANKDPASALNLSIRRPVRVLATGCRRRSAYALPGLHQRLVRNLYSRPICQRTLPIRAVRGCRDTSAQRQQSVPRVSGSPGFRTEH